MVMAAGTLVSRILGMVRALLLASILGLLTLSSNAFATANTVPNSIYLLVAGGLLNAALVPHIVKAAGRIDDGGAQTLNRLFTLAVTGLVAVTVLVVLLAPLVPVVLATSFDEPTARLTIALAYWCLPQVLFYGVYAVAGQILNAKGIFGPYTWAPAANNVVSIVGLLSFAAAFGASAGRQLPGEWTDLQTAVLAGTSTAGVAVQAAILIPALRRAGVRLRPRWRTHPADGMQGLGRVAGWSLASAAANQLGYVVTSNIAASGASSGGAGRTVWDNAYLLLMLPHSLITVSLVTALFTRLSRMAQGGDADGIANEVSKGLRLIVLATAPTATALLVLAPDIVQVLYTGNAATERRSLAMVVAIMGLALVPLSLQHLLQRAFYAYQDARTPFGIQAIVVAMSASVSVAGYAVLPKRWVVAGVAAGLAVGLTTGVLASLLKLRARVGTLPMRALTDVLLRAGVAAAFAGSCAYLTRILVATMTSNDWFDGLLRLVLAGIVLVLAYGSVTWLLKVAEMRRAFAGVRRWVRRSAA